MHPLDTRVAPTGRFASTSGSHASCLSFEHDFVAMHVKKNNPRQSSIILGNPISDRKTIDTDLDGHHVESRINRMHARCSKNQLHPSEIPNENSRFLMSGERRKYRLNNRRKCCERKGMTTRSAARFSRVRKRAFTWHARAQAGICIYIYTYTRVHTTDTHVTCTCTCKCTSARASTELGEPRGYLKGRNTRDDRERTRASLARNT